MRQTRLTTRLIRSLGLAGRFRATILAAAALFPAAALAAPCPTGMPVAGEFSSGFGYRGRGFHPGVDIRAPIGSAVRAASGGTVVFAGRYYAYGIMLEIEHQDGTRARYAHLARIDRDVRVGERIMAGQVIGAVGRTGRSTGPHLHVELRRDGRPTDPWPWLTRTACTDGIEIAEARR
ncbi:M23 family metallopeptidase [Roseomonas eburnea]|uniref:M23 family metallopeptidase n=1 Tax=Neoroseomonas eburnea TaxID=1346889 RepID=A0A9X9XFB5_9PROT|nr:M23 family metallopeptidase [Neoroseomonas eburnea]MBR0682401.1 M23 family metallopeptidase [Neoroseomonas eburnea]